MLLRVTVRTASIGPRRVYTRTQRRHLTNRPATAPSDDIAFAFDIDGVLLRSSSPIGDSPTALSHLLAHKIPFILLTNGGGKTEQARITDLRSKLSLPTLPLSSLIQSHTPFRSLTHLFSRPVLVIGGDSDSARLAAESYGFQHALTPSDIITAHLGVWPFSRAFAAYHAQHARPLPDSLPPIAAVLVFNDPRDFGLDLQLTVDLLLSDGGRLGTLSPTNGDATLPGRGYQYSSSATCKPPELHFSNPDLWWASDYPLSRLGQGAFRTALEGVWDEITGHSGTKLRRSVIGKPHAETYGFAERQLVALRAAMRGGKGPVPGQDEAGRDEVVAPVTPDVIGGKDGLKPLRKVYMIGDNPESDIRGANEWTSPQGTEWVSILVRTGVWRGHQRPRYEPKHVARDVWEAVRWALKDAEGGR